LSDNPFHPSAWHLVTASFAGQATWLAYMADEAVEGLDAFLEKRDSDCGRFPAILLIYGEQFPPNRINADLNQATHSPPRVR
jgi:hypothetical protein